MKIFALSIAEGAQITGYLVSQGIPEIDMSTVDIQNPNVVFTEIPENIILEVAKRIQQEREKEDAHAYMALRNNRNGHDIVSDYITR